MKVLKRLDKVVVSRHFLLFFFIFGLQGMVLNLWAHDILFAAINGLVAAVNLVILCLRSKPAPEVHAVTFQLGFNPETIMQLDERLAGVGRELGREPTTEKLMEVVSDLRSIVKELG